MKKFILLLTMILLSLAACSVSDTFAHFVEGVPVSALEKQSVIDERPDDIKDRFGDKKAVITAFNTTSTAFDALSADINSNPEGYVRQTVEVMVQMSDSLLQCKELLESDVELTAVEADALINELDNIKIWVTEAETVLLTER